MAKQLYGAEGVNINDSWYIRQDNRYYAYYLQYPSDAPEDGRWNQQSIGLSVSDNLLDWEYKGTVLAPSVECWCNKGLATGSTVEKDGMAHMLYTGNGWNGKDGLGLAVSRDFIHFERVGDGPVIRRDDPFLFPYRDGFLKCRILADPYIYPVPVDGYYYVFINCYAIDRPIGSRGCIVVMRSEDLISYQPYDVALLSDSFDRLETPQVWYQAGKWVMYFGAVKAREENGAAKDYAYQNLIYLSDEMTGGYVETEGSVLYLPDGVDFYIGKAVEISENDAVFIANVYPGGGRGLYHIQLQDGGVTITEQTELKETYYHEQ